MSAETPATVDCSCEVLVQWRNAGVPNVPSIGIAKVLYCPLHRDAGQLLAACEMALEEIRALTRGREWQGEDGPIEQLQAAIAAATSPAAPAAEER